MARIIDSDFLHRALQHFYGCSSFRTGQKEIISEILHGQPVLAVLPTGAGKSICFQLPSLLLKGVTLVISPLISLMKDQAEALTGYDFFPALEDELEARLEASADLRAWN